MYVVVETKGAHSDKEWAVRGVFQNTREASKFAWKALLLSCNRGNYINFWCDTTKNVEHKRIHCDKEYQILEWDMHTNMHLGTWYLDTKPFFNELGKQGSHEFGNTLAKFIGVLETHIPGKLWHECMTYEKCEHI